MMRASTTRFAALGVGFGALALGVLVPALAPATASLTVTKTADREHIDKFDNLNYTIAVNNAGPDPATGVVVTDRLPSGLSFVSVFASQGKRCEYRRRQTMCALGTIASGGSAAVSIKVRPRRRGLYTNTATVTSGGVDAQQVSDSETTRVFNRPDTNRRCGGRAVTIIGTPEADRIRGTHGRNVIASLGGNDVIHGLGGRDVICGSAGMDIIRGGGGKDVLIGGANNDRLLGGPGIDRCSGGPGRDTVRGCER